MVLEGRILCFRSYKNNQLKVNLWLVGAWERKKEHIFCNVSFVQNKFSFNVCFITLYRVLNKLSGYILVYILKNITSSTFLLLFKIKSQVKSPQCILHSFIAYSEKKQYWFIKTVGWLYLINITVEPEVSQIFQH